MEECEKKIDRLEKENDKLKDSLLELTTHINYSKENELLDFITERKTHPSERGWDVSDH